MKTFTIFTIIGASLLFGAAGQAAENDLMVASLFDGNRLPRDLPCPARAIIGGDASEPAISAASILAKTERDRLMRELDERHPGYGFSRHKGYPTPEHFAALERLGPCAAHRRGFAPVQRLVAPELF